MKRLQSFVRGRYLPAIAAGLVLAAAFPKIGLAGFAWIAPALIFLAAMGKPPGPAFRIGYVAGLAHHLASLYWLLLIPVPWQWKWAPVLGWAALSAFISIGTGTWTWFAAKLLPGAATASGPANGMLLESADRFLASPWTSRTAWCFSCAAFWVAIEMFYARIFGGFPWNLLGSSQFRITPLIQIASITGIYGVSFLVVWFSLSLLAAALAVLRKPAMRSAWMAEILLPLAAVGIVFSYGYRRTMTPAPGRPELTAALIQPSIPQTLIWDEAGDARRFQELLRLSEKAMAAHPALVIWPEAAVPKMVRYDNDTFQAITRFAIEHKVWMIVGSDDAEPHPHASQPNAADFFNSSFLISPRGELAERYTKQNLVIFGEYVPKWLPLLNHLTPIQGGFTAGDRPVPFHLGDLNVNVSVLICYEDVFPHLARHYVFDDTDFLVNLTNNGWFGEGAAQWQHAAGAVFRAVENAVPLVRCTNNGLTCWVDAWGRIRQVFADNSGRIYGPGYLIANIPMLLPGEKRAATFYRAHGDWFGWGCAAFAMLRLALALLPRPAARRAPSPAPAQASRGEQAP